MHCDALCRPARAISNPCAEFINRSTVTWRQSRALIRIEEGGTTNKNIITESRARHYTQIYPIEMKNARIGKQAEYTIARGTRQPNFTHVL